jgi:hypothetical protein
MKNKNKMTIAITSTAVAEAASTAAVAAAVVAAVAAAAAVAVAAVATAIEAATAPTVEDMALVQNGASTSISVNLYQLHPPHSALFLIPTPHHQLPLWWFCICKA